MYNIAEYREMEKTNMSFAEFRFRSASLSHDTSAPFAHEPRGVSVR